ncbi:MAG: hypothetical protein MUF48_07465, partial [Pirellulaceae bacterium]|nr:hypothetical protein [Pirellulaceae bacterium]
MSLRSFRRVCVLAVLIGCVGAVAVVLMRRSRPAPHPPAKPPAAALRIDEDPWFRLDQARKRSLEVAGTERAATVEKLCSTCHVLPAADCEPKDLWPSKIQEMYHYATTARPIQKELIPDISWP